MLFQKLIRATVNANRTKLRGKIDSDEAWIGGEQRRDFELCADSLKRR